MHQRKSCTGRFWGNVNQSSGYTAAMSNGRLLPLRVSIAFMVIWSCILEAVHYYFANTAYRQEAVVGVLLGIVASGYYLERRYRRRRDSK